MPLFKYRSISDVPRTERVGDALLSSRIRALWSRSRSFFPIKPRPGVQRFRTIEDANDDRVRATTERMRRGAGAP
jgi:hypothetical protein